jgi:excisionase family DNA binding protein
MSNEPDDLRRYVTRKHAACFLGVSVGTVDKWISSGLLRVVRLPDSNHLRIHIVELKRFEQEQLSSTSRV